MLSSREIVASTGNLANYTGLMKSWILGAPTTITFLNQFHSQLPSKYLFLIPTDDSSYKSSPKPKMFLFAKESTTENHNWPEVREQRIYHGVPCPSGSISSTILVSKAQQILKKIGQKDYKS